jgi:membrane fusion protein (multidrug efflux system)
VGRRVIIGLAVVVALAAVGWGAWAWHRSTIEVSTDDAYVEGMISPVSAKVSGHVVELLVNDNTAVRAGDVLLRVDPRDFESKRDQARAAVGLAEASVALPPGLPVTRDA